MGYPLPCSLTPTKVSAFKECAYAFRLGQIDRIPQPLTSYTVRGVIAHQALEEFYFSIPPPCRTPKTAQDAAHRAFLRAQQATYSRQFLQDLAPAEANRLSEEIASLVANVFVIEDPQRVRVLGTELQLEVELDGVLFRGIIDRLDKDANGGLVIVDYKTGRSPRHEFSQGRFLGVLFYALLAKKVLGETPRAVRLIYLGDRSCAELAVSPQKLRAVESQTHAIWNAVTTACETETFRPRPSRHCLVCAYRGICPSAQH